jgi:hypothetical protein
VKGVTLLNTVDPRNAIANTSLVESLLLVFANASLQSRLVGSRATAYDTCESQGSHDQHPVHLLGHPLRSSGPTTVARPMTVNCKGRHVDAVITPTQAHVADENRSNSERQRAKLRPDGEDWSNPPPPDGPSLGSQADSPPADAT